MVLNALPGTDSKMVFHDKAVEHKTAVNYTPGFVRQDSRGCVSIVDHTLQVGPRLINVQEEGK
jgi:hypothetical protein